VAAVNYKTKKMAKKIKHHRKRRSVGAFDLHHSSPLVMFGSMAAGYFLDSSVGVNNMIYGMLPGTVTVPASGTTAAVNTPTSTMGYLVSGAEAGLGAMLLMSKKKSMIKTVAGGVSLGVAVHSLLKQAKVISGYQSVPVVGRRRMAGYQSTPVVGAIPQALQGYRVNGGIPQTLQGYVPNGSNQAVMGGYSNGGSSCMQ
jgi:hypothetical protein